MPQTGTLGLSCPLDCGRRAARCAHATSLGRASGAGTFVLPPWESRGLAHAMSITRVDDEK